MLSIAPGHRSPFNLFSFQRQFDPATPPGRRTTQLGALPRFQTRSAFNKFCLSPIVLKHSVEMTGFEPVTFALQRRCSPAELHPQDLPGLVGLTGFEPVTPALSAQCSNQLSYKPRVHPQQLRSDRKRFLSIQHPITVGV